MQYYHDFESIHLTNTVVACGKFDGMHKGHQKLIEKLLQYKKQFFRFHFPDRFFITINPDKCSILLVNAKFFRLFFFRIGKSVPIIQKFIQRSRRNKLWQRRKCFIDRVQHTPNLPLFLQIFNLTQTKCILQIKFPHSCADESLSDTTTILQ